MEKGSKDRLKKTSIKSRVVVLVGIICIFFVALALYSQKNLKMLHNLMMDAASDNILKRTRESMRLATDVFVITVSGQITKLDPYSQLQIIKNFMKKNIHLNEDTAKFAFYVFYRDRGIVIRHLETGKVKLEDFVKRKDQYYDSILHLANDSKLVEGDFFVLNRFSGKSKTVEYLVYATNVPESGISVALEYEVKSIRLWQKITREKIKKIISEYTGSVVSVVIIVFTLSIIIAFIIIINISSHEKDEISFRKRLEKMNELLNIEINLKTEIEKELKDANRELSRLSSLDGLTCIANRRRFDEYLTKEWERLKREKKPMSLIMCDIDYFKKYNDKYGHQEGDKCIKNVAGVIEECSMRPADLSARYGGEEFAVILPDTPVKGAEHIAEAIMEKMNEISMPHEASEVSEHVTLSIGIGTLVPLSGNKPADLIHNADRALYEAKHQGRNRVIVFY